MSLDKLVESFVGFIGAGKKKQDAAKARDENLSFLKQLDYSPQYASDRAPAWQGTESPLSRKFLESLIMGMGPQSSTRAGAPMRENMNRGVTDALYGTDPMVAMEAARDRADPSEYALRGENKELPTYDIPHSGNALRDFRHRHDPNYRKSTLTPEPKKKRGGG